MTQGAPTPPEDGDNSPAALWDAARYALHWLVNLFVSPSEMAGWGVLAPWERVDVLGWLRPLEALVRALLVIKAADLPPALGSARSAKRAASRPRRMTLEQAIAWIDDDELVEVTPNAVRVRKRWLDPHERKRREKAGEMA